MPAFVWDLGGEQQGFVHLDGFYGFPAVDGPRGGVKVASESYERTVTADGHQHPATRPEIDQIYDACIAPHLPWLDPEPLKTVSCLYTSTRGPIRDRPSPRARLSPNRLRVLRARVQAVARDRRGGRAMADRTSARHRAQCVQLLPGPAVRTAPAADRCGFAFGIGSPHSPHRTLNTDASERPRRRGQRPLSSFRRLAPDAPYQRNGGVKGQGDR